MKLSFALRLFSALIGLAFIKVAVLKVADVVIRPRTCRCGHTSAGHEHLRAGTDCAFCPCEKFSR